MSVAFRLFAALVVGHVPAATLSAQTLPPDADRVLARTILEELVEINTTNTEAGDNTAAARAAARYLLEAGFPAED
ncbi:MAG: hypothetical protein RLN75_08345, partial [Longimicrobiales bacterium]